jgi:2EXR family
LPLVPLSEFHLFPKLPPEIRSIIWKCAIPGQLAVHVIPQGVPKDPKPARQPEECKYRLRYGPGGFMDYIPTVLLHICKESRSLAGKRFKPFIGGPWGNLPLYFDFVGDTLFFNDKLGWKFI